MTASRASREGGKVRWGEDWTWEQIGLCGKGVGLDSGHRVLPAPAKIFRSENIPFRFSLSKELKHCLPQDHLWTDRQHVLDISTSEGPRSSETYGQSRHY